MNQTVTSVIGTHDNKLGNKDVKTFYVHSEKEFKYLPVGLNNIFPNLNKLDVQRTPLKIINKSDFIGLDKIEQIHFTDNQIENIHGEAFSTLVRLKYINLSNNSIEILASNTFENLKNLQEVYFHKNRIQVLDSLLFRNNDKLKTIIFNRNQLVNIGKDLIRKWNRIKTVELFNNTCINNSFNSIEDEKKFNEHVASNCSAPMVILTLVSYETIKNVSKYFETKLEDTKAEFANYKQASEVKEPEPHDGSIVNKVEVVAYFFKTVFDHQLIVYTSVIINVILLALIFIRRSSDKNFTHITDTTLILQQKQRKISIASKGLEKGF
ncbi:unnamed protein product [Diamesa serratosioi]